MGNNMLIWEALAKVKSQLILYIQTAPEAEKESLSTQLKLIAQVENDIFQALNQYQYFIEHIEKWYQQLDLDKVNTELAILLLHDTNKVLRALETDSKQLIWPLSTQVPKTLYSDIEKLLELSSIKEIALNDKQQHKLLPPNTQDQLNHLLNAGIQTLMTKKNVLAEQKQANLHLVRQLKELAHCLSLPTNEIIQQFWQQYSEPEAFEALMTLLLITTEEEKKAWLLTHAYYRVDLSNDSNTLTFLNKNISSLYLFSTKKFFGKTLTPDLLKQRLQQSIKLFYGQVVEEQQQSLDADNWLKEIEATIEGGQIDPTLHELIMFQQVLNEPLSENLLSVDKQNTQLNTLSLIIEKTDQKKARSIKKIRQELNQLQTDIKDVQIALELRNQAHQMIFQQIDSLEHSASLTEFNLTELDKTKLIDLANQFRQELKQNFLTLLPKELELQVGIDNQLAFNQFQDYLKEKSKSVELLIENFNHDGEAERHRAILELSSFINQKHDIWEYILRFFSTSYRQCMANIESTLRNDGDSLSKIESITKQFQSTKQEAGFFVHQRLTMFTSQHKEGMFKPYEAKEDDYALCL